MSESQNVAKRLTAELWSMANDLRGKMNADEYRNYILGFIFYRYLSARQEQYLIDSGNLEPESGESANDAYLRQAAPNEIDE